MGRRCPNPDHTTNIQLMHWTGFDWGDDGVYKDYYRCAACGNIYLESKPPTVSATMAVGTERGEIPEIIRPAP